MTRLILCSKALELELAPVTGGSIARFDRVGAERTAIMRGAERPDASVLDMGCFPLVPYCNRIRGGRFAFRGREIVQQPNMADDPSPLHGHGWLAPWTLVEQSETSAHLLYRHEPDEWPWEYGASQRFALDADGLHIALTCRNLSDEPMPCGLGFHPYFPCSGATELDTQVKDVWTVDEHVLPVERVPAEGRYDLKQRRICGQGLDNGFSDWSGEAWIRSPDAGLAIHMASPNARFFQVYSPGEGGLFVAEPVSHANAALNESEERWAELGIKILEPGEEAKLSVRLDVVSC
jgi:aldose 1-epimerase